MDTTNLLACGVDGCKDGWFLVVLGPRSYEFSVVTTFGEVVQAVSPRIPILVDIPIGLRDSGSMERLCDLEARAALKQRSSTVFPVPARTAVYAPDYETANARNRRTLGKGLSRQSWGIVPKIREVDSLLQEQLRLRSRIREVHPEVCFWGLTGRPMQHKKKSREGYDERLAALTQVEPAAEEIVGQAVEKHCGFGVQRDDIIDALVAAVCARHLSESRTLPEEPETDSTGLPMEMVYWPVGLSDE